MEKRAAEVKLARGCDAAAEHLEETEADPEDMVMKEPQEVTPLRRGISRVRRRWPFGHRAIQKQRRVRKQPDLWD